MIKQLTADYGSQVAGPDASLRERSTTRRGRGNGSTYGLKLELELGTESCPGFVRNGAI